MVIQRNIINYGGFQRVAYSTKQNGQETGFWQGCLRASLNRTAQTTALIVGFVRSVYDIHLYSYHKFANAFCDVKHIRKRGDIDISKNMIFRICH